MHLSKKRIICSIAIVLLVLTANGCSLMKDKSTIIAKDDLAVIKTMTKEVIQCVCTRHSKWMEIHSPNEDHDYVAIADSSCEPDDKLMLLTFYRLKNKAGMSNIISESGCLIIRADEYDENSGVYTTYSSPKPIRSYYWVDPSRNKSQDKIYFAAECMRTLTLFYESCVREP